MSNGHTTIEKRFEDADSYKLQHLSYTGTFWEVDLLSQALTSYLSTSFLELEKRWVKSKCLTILGNAHKSALCY